MKNVPKHQDSDHDSICVGNQDPTLSVWGNSRPGGLQANSEDSHQQLLPVRMLHKAEVPSLHGRRHLLRKACSWEHHQGCQPFSTVNEDQGACCNRLKILFCYCSWLLSFVNWTFACEDPGLISVCHWGRLVCFALRVPSYLLNLYCDGWHGHDHSARKLDVWSTIAYHYTLLVSGFALD